MTTPPQRCLVATTQAMSSLTATKVKITTTIATNKDREKRLAVIRSKFESTSTSSAEIRHSSHSPSGKKSLIYKKTGTQTSARQRKSSRNSVLQKTQSNTSRK